MSALRGIGSAFRGLGNWLAPAKEEDYAVLQRWDSWRNGYDLAGALDQADDELDEAEAPKVPVFDYSRPPPAAMLPDRPASSKMLEELDALIQQGTSYSDEFLPDGSLVLHLKLEPEMVGAIDRARDRFGLADRAAVLQKGIELIKLLSTRRTYNEIQRPLISEIDAA